MPQGRHRTESKTSPRRIMAVERQRQALELRKAGLTLAQIAERLGYRGAQGADAALKVALKRTLQKPADEHRQLDLERLDSLLRAVWAKGAIIAAGQTHIPPDALPYWDRILVLLRRRAELLGLNAPVKQEVSGPDGGPIKTVSLTIDSSTLADALRALAEAGVTVQGTVISHNGETP